MEVLHFQKPVRRKMAEILYDILMMKKEEAEKELLDYLREDLEGFERESRKQERNLMENGMNIINIIRKCKIKEETNDKDETYYLMNRGKWNKLYKMLDRYVEIYKDNIYYHVVIDSDKEDVIRVWKMYCNVLQFKTDCLQMDGRKHSHFLFVSKDKKEVLERVEKTLDILPQVAYKEYYVKRIFSKSHLVNSIIYLQRRIIEGPDHKEVIRCEHKWKRCIFRDKRESLIFLKYWNNSVINEEYDEEFIEYINSLGGV